MGVDIVVKETAPDLFNPSHVLANRHGVFHDILAADGATTSSLPDFDESCNLSDEGQTLWVRLLRTICFSLLAEAIFDKALQVKVDSMLFQGATRSFTLLMEVGELLPEHVW